MTGFLAKFSGESHGFFSTGFAWSRQNSCKDDKPPKIEMQEILQIYNLYYAALCEYPALDSGFREAYNTSITSGRPEWALHKH